MATSPPRTRAELLATEIEQRVTGDSLRAGTLLGTIDGLREETGFARSTVSEAVRLLADRGVIQIRPGRGGGLFVAQDHAVVRLRHTLLTVREIPAPVADAIAVRDALEALIDTDAALHRDAQDIRDLKAALVVLDRARKDPERFMRANWALHERVAAITPNTILQAVYRGTTRYIADAATAVTRDGGEEYVQQRYEIHQRLVAAIVAGDRDAARAAAVQHAGHGPDAAGPVT